MRISTAFAIACAIGCDGDTKPVDETSCRSPMLECSSLCVDAQNDERHCGGCSDAGGATCVAGEICHQGACVLSCPTTLTECDSNCVNTDTDRAHCGGCSDAGGDICVAGEICHQGGCVLSCPAALTECDSTCVDTDIDRTHCGGCSDAGGDTCVAGEICHQGGCVLSCPAPLTECSDACVNTDIDRGQCGGCSDAGGDVCVAGEICHEGNCVLNCPAALTECDGACVDTRWDSAHCGDCASAGGAVCTASEFCDDGVCETTCHKIATAPFFPLLETFDAQWSHSGTLLTVVGSRMITGSHNVQVLSVGETNLTLHAEETHGIHMKSVSWSQAGDYLAVGGSNPIPPGDGLTTLAFDGTTFSHLACTCDVTYTVCDTGCACDRECTSNPYMGAVTALDWSPSSTHLAVAWGTVDLVRVSPPALTALDSVVATADPQDVTWSPGGQYLAVAGDEDASYDGLAVLLSSGDTLTLVTSHALGAGATSVAWSGDGAHLVVGSANATGELQTFSFNGSTLTTVDTIDLDAEVEALDWSPDTGVIVAAGNNLNSNDDLVFFQTDAGMLTEDTAAGIVTSALPRSVQFDPSGELVAVTESEPVSLGSVAVYRVCLGD